MCQGTSAHARSALLTMHSGGRCRSLAALRSAPLPYRDGVLGQPLLMLSDDSAPSRGSSLADRAARELISAGQPLVSARVSNRFGTAWKNVTAANGETFTGGLAAPCRGKQSPKDIP